MREVLIGVAHGSRDPRAAAVAESLMAQVQADADVKVAYLDHAVPSLRQLLGSVSGPVYVAPLLLTAAYHTKVDIPRVLAGFPGAVLADPLGPHPLLARLLDQRLAAASGGAGRLTTGVVLAAAGTADPSAVAAIGQFAMRWRARSGWRDVVPAFASAAAPSVGDAVRSLRARGLRRVVVATYLLAPGLFADRVRAEAVAAGADAVSDPLGAAPELAEIVTERYEAARRARARAA